jgi:Protein of unknown function (DUF3341)
MAEKLYGIMAEFDTATELVDAARVVRDAGYVKTDAFSPFPIHEIDEALGIRRSILPYLIFAGGLAGLFSALALVYYVHVFDFPIIVGGRPHFSLPAFIPPMFELTVLFSAFVAVFGMLFLNKLPSPYHPVFNVPRFVLASREKFFLIIESADELYDYDKTRELVGKLNAQEVFDVEE